jgi:hypothetical protein
MNNQTNEYLSKNMVKREDLMCSEDCIKEIDIAIRNYLDFCDSNITPEICKLKADPDSMQNLITEIRTLIAKQGYDIKEAVLYLERIKNPNIIDD